MANDGGSFQPNPNFVPSQGQFAGAAPAYVHQLDTFPVVLLILLHFLTCGLFSVIWINLMHGRLPRVRYDDPSAGKAVGFCFIPFFNLYWIFFTTRRLCERVDEQRRLYGLQPSNLTGMATTACIFQVIPYINFLLGLTIFWPIYIGLMQSSVNQLVEKSRTTTPQGNLVAQPAAPGMPGWAIALIVCGCLIPFLIAFFAALLLPALAISKEKAVKINCASKLNQVGLAFRTWGLDNGDLYPFNVSTNKGGTLEWCAPGPDGLDQNAWHHFQVMSNELNNPKLLVCPGDKAHHPAISFGDLNASTVTYQVHSGKSVSDANPRQVLAICPIHHNVLYADGSVQQLSPAAMQQVMDKLAAQ